MQSEWRKYTSHKHGANPILESWRDKRCIQCSRFLPKQCGQDCCHKCYIQTQSIRAFVYSYADLFNIGDYVGEICLSEIERRKEG